MINIIGAFMFISYAISNLPQLIKILRSKKSSQLTIYTPLLLIFAASTAIIYTYFTGGGVWLIADYTMSLITQSLLLFYIIKYKNNV